MVEAPAAQTPDAFGPMPEMYDVARTLLLLSTSLIAPRRKPACCGVKRTATLHVPVAEALQVEEAKVKSGLPSELLGTPSVKTTGVPRVTPLGIVKVDASVSPMPTTVNCCESGVAAR